MAIRIKSASAAADKFVTRGSAAGKDYADGVSNPKQPWAAATLAAKDAYQQGVNEAISRGAFEKGVSKAGDDKYQRKALSVGSQRLGQGITAAKSDYMSNVQPFFDVISNITLPPRGPKGSPQNLNRVQVIAAALRAKKLGS